ncbi:Permease of the drug/metabolite transporter (DMT) superfamily, partial [hydrothermal vent metagenome]
YEIHWSEVNSPNQWNFIHTANQSPIDGDIVYNWIPNQNGAFTIKLTAIDKAGNAYSDSEQVFINGSTSAIRQIDISPKFFSPNGDGVKDTISIQYEVLAATEVLIEIEDETGLVVRTYEREYLNPINMETIQWDGRNQDGTLLADGRYRVIVQGYSHNVYLDTQSVEFINLALIPGLYNQLTNSLTYVSHLLDNKIDEIIYNSDEDFTGVYQFYNMDTLQWGDSHSITISLTPDSIRDLNQNQFRLKTEDKAGNIGLSPISFPQLKPQTTEVIKIANDNINYTFKYLYNEGTNSIPDLGLSFPKPTDTPEIVDWSNGNKLAFTVQMFDYDDVEFIRLKVSYIDPVTGEDTVATNKLVNSTNQVLAMQYFKNRLIGVNEYNNQLFDISSSAGKQPVLLIELEQDDFPVTTAIVKASFEIKFASQVQPHITDSFIQFDTAEIYKNLVQISFNANRDLGVGHTENTVIAYENIINTIPPNTGLDYYWFYLDKNISLTENNLIVRDINSNQEFYSPDFIDSTEDYLSVLFIVPPGTCKVKNSIYWRGKTVDGADVVSDPLHISNDFCVSPFIQPYFYLGEFCKNEVVSNAKIKFEILANNINPQSNLPILVELYDTDPNGLEMLIFADTNPELNEESDGTFSYFNSLEYDSTSIVKGQHFYKISMTDILGSTETEIIPILLDSNLATNHIISPEINTQICATSEFQGIININVGGHVNLSSPFGAQVHLVLDDGSLPFISEINHQEYNRFSKLGYTGEELNIIKYVKAPYYNGQASLILETFNSSGVSYCSNVNISIDALVDFNFTYSALVGHTFINGKSYISPNADGAKDTLKLIGLEANEALDITIKLNEANNSNISLGVISSSSLITNEIEEFNWDGKLNGVAVADGEYTIVIDIVDTCGLVKIIKIPVIVDTTQPINTFVSPIDAGNLNAIQRVDITIEEGNLTTVNISEMVIVDYFYNSVWNQLELLAGNFNDQTGLFELQLDWNLTNLPPAIYPLRITSEDLAGNVAVTTINPELINQQDIFWNYTLSPLYISPNADTVQDNAVIEFSLNLESIVSINILDNNQIVVRSLVTEQNFPAQSNQLLFNGLNDSQIVLSDGVYTVEIIANEAANLTNSSTLELPITIDNQAPIIQWLPPLSNVTKGEGTAQIVLDELYPASLEVSNQQMQPLKAPVSVLNTNQSGTLNLFDLASLNETHYQLSATAVDLAGNRITASLSYLIDNTPPEIELTTPLNDTFVGGSEAQIAIAGNILEDNFEHYELALSPNSEPFVWQTIHTSTEITDSQFDYQWLSAVNDDDYLLRLTAYDQAGWVTETSHVIVLDKTSPQALITQPLNNTLVGANTEIYGSVLDENFDFYSLSYKLSTSDTWKLFTFNQSPISTNLLGTLPASLASGSYDIKLITQDKIGLTSEYQISIVVDVEPPPAPVNLTLEMINNQVFLNWQTVTVDDLEGYLIHRNGESLLPQPLNDTDYLDTTVTDGDYVYTVSAIDSFGNLSQPSNQVTATIDTTPPEVSIVTPVANQRVNNNVEIIGTALSLLDFNNYKLYYRQVAQDPPGTLIHQSSLPVSLDLLGLFDSTLVAQEQDYIIRLEASDHSDNTAISEQTVYVDNNAPTAPLNLTHQLQGVTSVLLQWSANNETDLIGYLVYQNGVVISGTGNGNPSIANAITATNFTIDNLIDGLHDFNIAAIDQTGNISQFSNTVSETINNRVPDTIITTPITATRFEAPILIEATSPDNDIAEIKFEYSIDNVNWIELSIDQQQPYQVILNPVTLSLTFGNLYLRATATDTGAQVDSTPAQVTVEYADLTAPLSVENVVANIDGGEINLTWDANSETDLQGYLIYQTIDGVTTTLTNPAITTTSYSDNNLLDGTYSYQISAIDNADNESSKIQIDNLQVFSISMEQPYSPLLMPNQVQLNGQSPRSDGVINTLLQNNNGNSQLADIIVNNDNTFISPTIDLEVGLNSFTATHSISTTHNSKTSTVQLELSPIPQIPINLQVNVVGLTSGISWDTTADTFAYLPYRNGQPIYPVESVTNIATYQASSSQSSASRVGDNDLSTYWGPSFSDMTDENPTFIEVTLDQPRWITEVKLTWYEVSSTVYQASHYEIQYFSSVGWVTIEEFDTNNQSIVTNSTDIPYLTDKVRLVIKTPLGVYESIRLSEFAIKQQPITDQNSLSLDEADGSYSYQISSINSYGFQSVLSDAVAVNIGDTTAPETVVLSANISGNNDVLLNWVASVSTDVSNYWLFRNDELILITADETILNFTDSGLINGQYNYTVKAVDAVGNSSESSNIVTIDIQQQDLPIPQGLRIFAILTGNGAQLNWDIVSSSRLHHYNIFRSLVSTGPYNKIGETIEVQFIDSALVNGTSYYYVITTADEFNNESDYSNEVVVVPTDSLPASKPIITYPTTFNNPITINQIMSDIFGFSDPGVLIDLYHNDNYSRTVTSATEYSVQTQELINLDTIVLNKNGKYNAYSDFSEKFIVQDKITGDKISQDMFINSYSWSADGTLIYVIQADLVQGGKKLTTYNHELNEVAVIFNETSIYNAMPSPDDTKVFYRGNHTDSQTGQSSNGVWLFDRTTSTALEIPLIVSPQLVPHSIVWSPNSQSIAFINTTNGGELYLYHIDTETLEVIATDFNFNASIDWSQDGDTLLYGRDTTEPKLYTYDLNTSISTALPATDGAYKHINYSPDNSQVAYLQGCCDIAIYDSINQTTQVIYQNNNTIQSLIWSQQFGIEFWHYRQYSRLVGPGNFIFADVLLDSGLNQFHTIARDGSGIPSSPSLPINITVDSTGLADISVVANDLLISPISALQGSSFVASVLVKNNSDQVIIDAAIRVSVTLPDGSIEEINLPQNSISLQPFASQSVFIDMGIRTVIGQYIVQVIIDEENQIEEINEHNNRANQTFSVLENLNPVVQVFVAPQIAAPNQPVSINIDIFNPAETFNGKICLTIKDINGFPVANTIEFPINQLTNNSNQVIDYIWQTQDILAGIYQIQSVLKLDNGNEIVQVDNSVEIIALAEFSISLDTQSSSVAEGESILYASTINYIAGNTPQNGNIIWEIVDDNQQIVWTQTQLLPEMHVGFSTVINNQWQAQFAGSYQLIMYLTADNYQQTLSQPFEVVLATVGVDLKGQLASTPSNIVLGNDFIIDYSLTNSGDSDLTDIPINIQLLSSNLSTILASNTSVLTLPIGQSTTLATPFSSIGLTTENYLLALYADLSSVGGSNNQLIDTRSINTIDTTGPEIIISTPLANSLQPANIDVRYVITDLYSQISSITFQSADINQGNPIAVNINQINNSYNQEIFNLAQGLHQLTITATDSSGNSSQQTIDFSVDPHAPLIDITGVQDNTYYNQTVTATVDITDSNLITSEILLNNTSISSPHEITDEGSYFLTVRAEDFVGNVSYQSINFTIDLTAPEITLTYPDNNAEIGQLVTNITGYTNENATIDLTIGAYSDQVYTNNSSFFRFEDVPLQLGANSVDLSATDLASNQSVPITLNITAINQVDIAGQLDDDVNFAVEQDLILNYSLTNNTANDFSALATKIEIFSLRPHQLVEGQTQTVELLASQSLNSNLVFTSPDLLAGNYQVILSILETGQWQQKAEKTISLFRTEYGIHVNLPLAGHVYNADIITSVDITEAFTTPPDVQYRLDDSEQWISMVNTQDENYIANLTLDNGTHVIRYRINDDNTQSPQFTTIVFDVDTIAPKITVTNPTNGLITNQDVTLEFFATDEQDFELLGQLNAINVVSGQTITNEAQYTLEITATDSVNNQASDSLQFIIDKTNPTITLTNVVDNQQIIVNGLSITGTTEPFASLTLDFATSNYSTNANELGEFNFENVLLNSGENNLLFGAIDRANNQSDPLAITLNFSELDACSVFGFNSVSAYNAFVFNDYTARNSVVEGRLAAGNNIVIQHYYIGENLVPTEAGDALIAGSDISFAHQQLHYGNILAAGQANIGQTVIDNMQAGAQVVSNAQLPLDFNQNYQQLRLFSNALAEQSENSTYVINNQILQLQGDCTADLQVYNINSTDLKNIQSFAYSCLDENAYLILNIDAETIGFNSVDLNLLAPIQQRIIWNFHQAQQIELFNINIQGSILAVDAHVATHSDNDVIFKDGFEETTYYINGQLIARSFNSQMHIRHLPLVCSDTIQVNATPIAPDLTLTTNLNTPLLISLSVMDENMPSLEYQLLSQVSSGQLTGSLPNLTYIPETDFVGVVSFDYEVTDQYGKTNNATISIEISDDLIFTNSFETTTKILALLSPAIVLGQTTIALVHFILWRRK